jgi:hypothetical protein
MIDNLNSINEMYEEIDPPTYKYCMHTNHRQFFTFFKISKNTERILFAVCLGSSKIFLKKF